MFNADSNLVVLTPTGEIADSPFQNPVCQGTYQSLPKIYGRQGRKKYMLNIRQLLRIPPEKKCIRECCLREDSQVIRSSSQITKIRKIQIENMLSQPKINGCAKKVCSCHSMMENRPPKTKKKPLKIFYNNQKLGKIKLPSLKQFTPDDLESRHKIYRSQSRVQLQMAGISGFVQSQPIVHKSRVKTDSRGQQKYSQQHFQSSKSKKSFKATQIAQSGRYYEYLENIPSGDKERKLNLVKTQGNKPQSQCLSLSSQVLKNSHEKTLFHLNKLKASMQRKQDSVLKLSKVYSVLSNGLFKIPEENELADYIRDYKAIYSEFNLKNILARPSFKIIPSKQCVYFGETQNRMKHGQGVNVTLKEIYQGLYQNNLKIQGSEKNADGIYTGQYRNSKRNGRGIFVWNNNQVFEGQWKDGKKNGFGIWTSPKGSRYEGNWQNNRQSGAGIFHHEESIYNGHFKDFLKHGQGKQEFTNGDSYEGAYFEGKPQGIGRYEWANGDIYQGSFQNGQRSGLGTLFSSNGDVYEGIFVKDVKHGKGKQKYNSGQYFEGQFFEGKIKRGVLVRTSGGKISIN